MLIRPVPCLLVGLLGLAIGLSPIRAQSPDPLSPQALFARNQFAQAKAAYEAAIRQKPSAPDLYVGYLQTLLRLDQWSEACDQGHRAVEKFPHDASVHGLYILALLRAGQVVEARHDWKRNISVVGSKHILESYWEMVALGQTVLRTGEPSLACRCFRHALKEEPRGPDAWLGLYMALGSGSQEGRAAIKSYLGLHPEGYPHDLYVESLENSLTSGPPIRHAVQHATFEQAFRAASAPRTDMLFSVPIEREKDEIRIPVRINGHLLHLQVDTGAGDVILSGETARQMGLQEVATKSDRGFQGDESEQICAARILTIGGLALRSLPIRVVTGSKQDHGKIGDGIIGTGIFKGYVVTLDYEKNRMTVTRASEAHRPAIKRGEQLVFLPFIDLSDTMLLQCWTHAGRSWGVFDTGSDSIFLSMRLARHLAAANPQASVQTQISHDSIAIGTSAMEIQDLILSAPQLISVLGYQLGTGPHRSIELKTSSTEGMSGLDEQISPALDWEVGMDLGEPFAEQFRRVIIDYAHNRLYLVSPAPSPKIASR